MLVSIPVMGRYSETWPLMARLCGVEVDEYTLQESLKAFYRFAGHGNVAYGDGLPEGGYRDNGKTGGLAVAMSAAAMLPPRARSRFTPRPATTRR